MLVYNREVSDLDKALFDDAMLGKRQTFTLTFPIDKYEIDITAVPSDEGSYVDAVMFLEGHEVCVIPDVGETLMGEYRFTGVDREDICLILE